MSVPVRLLEERANALEVRVLESGLDEPPPRDLLERTLVTVGVTAGIAAASASAQAASAAGGAKAGAALTGVALAKWLGVGLLGGLALAGGMEVSGMNAAPEAPRPGIQHAALGRVASARSSEAAPAAPPEAPTEATSPPAPPAAPALSAPASTSGAESSRDLAAEVALLDAARQALHGGDARRALALLDQHAREFPAGRLRPEAEVTRIEAVAKNDPKAASAMARAFLERHPDSPHAERVRAFVRQDRASP